MTYLVLWHNGQYWETFLETPTLSNALEQAQLLFEKIQSPVEVIDHEGYLIEIFD